MSDWQPIETAKKDGKPVLVCFRENHKYDTRNTWGSVRIAKWDREGVWRLYGYYQLESELSGWMPLPGLPK